MRYEPLFASVLLIGCPVMAWIEFTTFWQSGKVKSSPFAVARPFPAIEIDAFEVSKDVGNVRNNSPDLL